MGLITDNYFLNRHLCNEMVLYFDSDLKSLALYIFFVSVFSPCSSVSVLGGSLESVMGQDGCLSEDVVRRFGWDLVKGLKHIHELGIIFSDLTPAKVCTCVHVYVGPTV